jgi:hypothetical protein
MIERPDTNRLERMGLVAPVAFDARVLPPPPNDDRPRGYAVAALSEGSDATVGDAVSASRLGVAPAPPRHVERLEGQVGWPEGERVGFELWWVGDQTLKLRSDEPIEADSDPATPASLERIDACTFCWDVSQAANSAVFLRGDGTGVWIDAPDHSGGQLVAWIVDQGQGAVGARFEAPIDVEAAVSMVADDPWLADRVRARAQDGDSWDALCAVSLIDRLYEPPRDVRLAALRRMLESGDSGLPEPGLMVMRQLGPEARVLAERMAVTAAELLAVDLERVFGEIDPEDPSWCEAVLGLLEAREELDAVAELLELVGAGAGLGAALEELDEALGGRGQQLPEFEAAEFEYLDRAATRRAASGLPAQWWIKAVLGLDMDDDA